MAARRGYAVGTDDVGTVAAGNIEVSTSLHLLAEVPPPDPAVAAEVLLGLEPAKALALCESSPFYQEICDSDGFRERYQTKWMVRASAATLTAGSFTYHFLRTRVVGDIKTLYERDTGVSRTDYMMLYEVPTVDDFGYIEVSLVHPTAQSTLGGMIGGAVLRQGVPYLGFDVLAETVPPSQPAQFTHYFASGESIELSE